MVGSARSLLDDDEEVLAEVRPHVVYVLPPLAVVAVAVALTVAVRFPSAPIAVAWLLAAMILVPSLWAGARLLRWRSTRFLVTENRLVYRRGVFGRDVVQLRLQRLAEVHCTQSVIGRVIGCGRLVFEVASGDGPLVVEDVPRPRSVQRLITRTLDEMEPPYGPTPRGVPSPGSPGRTWTQTPPHGVAAPAATATAAEFTPASVPGRLVQLDELRRRGIISQAEFAAKKAELLHRL